MTKKEFVDVFINNASKVISDNTVLQFLEMSLNMSLVNYELVELTQLPSTDVYNNDYILKRFAIDMLAKGLSESTVKQYIRAANNFLLKVNLLYRDVKSQDIIDYLIYKQYQDKISNSYKATLQGYLCVFFTWCYNKEYIDKDIVKSIDPVKFKKKPKERVSDEEVEKIRNSVKNNLFDKALLELMLSTGLRVSEICTLKIEDINFQNNTIKIWGEKTDEQRTGFLSAGSKIAIQEYIKERTEGPLFLNRSKKICSARTIETHVKRFGESIDLSFITTVHTFRKTFASIMYRKTSDILLVSKLLGHANTSTTVNYYLVDDIEEMKHKIERVF